MSAALGYCHCGCGGSTGRYAATRRGHKKGELKKWIRGHNSKVGPSPEERFWEKVNKDASNGCWEWTATIAPTGYGRFALATNDIRYSHRYSHELAVGPIPDGLQIDHLCRNRKCCNPDHLEAVTQAENLLRGVSPPALNARKTHCSRGHEYTNENTRVNKYGHRQCRACCRITDEKRRAAV